MSVIQINGRTFNVSGNNVTIRNNTVIVDGVVIQDGLSGIVEIKWDGPLANLTSDASVTAGNVAGDIRAGGSVQCDDVHGSVAAGGSVQCDDVYQVFLLVVLFELKDSKRESLHRELGLRVR